MIVDRTDRYCVLGAGSAGLTAAKNLLEFDINVDVLEREDDLGGNWNFRSPYSSVYSSIHLITSKPFIQYTDYPMPDHYPTYIGHVHALEYLRSYAEHFGVLPHIQFNTTVTNIERRDGTPDWFVTLADGEVRRYAGVVIANGHNWKPRYPDFPGHFDGETIHSADYKNPDILRDKRVLVVGAGTSACDIAVEGAQNAAKTFQSIRRGCYYWPKYLFGLPTDVIYELVLKTRTPLPVFRFFAKMFLRLNSSGSPARYGLPKPPHKLFEEHFVINSTLLYHLGHGEIHLKPNVEELKGDRVRFTDGSEEQIDVIVYGTGFHQAEFPFIDRKYLNWPEGQRIPLLHLNAFHPVYNNLFVIGYFQTSTGNWPIADHQSKVMARYVYLSQTDPKRVLWFRQEKAEPVPGSKLNGGIRYYDSERHWLQVEHFSYRAKMKDLVRRLNVKAPKRAAGGAVTPNREAVQPVPVGAGGR